MTDSSVSEKLESIQSQLAMLQSDYKNLLRTYYNMFYNTNPMTIELKLYNDRGELETIQVPNRAKDTSSYTKIYNGNPKGQITGNLGEICLDTTTNSLYYNTATQGSEGWVKIHSMENFTPDIDYLTPTGDGSQLYNLDASKITFDRGILEVYHGGTGVSGYNEDGSVMDGLIKIVPGNIDSGVKPKFTIAEKDVDYATTTTYTGMIVFVPREVVPTGFLVCDGRGYVIQYTDETGDHRPYGALYDFFTLRYDAQGAPYRVEAPFGEYEEYDESLGQIVRKFRLPDLTNNELFIRSWNPESNKVFGVTEDDHAPNVTGNWAQEITGIQEEFKGAISVALDEEGKPVMVPGSSSLPGGSYDYKINFNLADSNINAHRVYQDDATEITVKNIALLPVIKY